MRKGSVITVKFGTTVEPLDLAQLKLLANLNKFHFLFGKLKADFQSSHEAPRNSLRVLASN
jgi:hypothetical protein